MKNRIKEVTNINSFKELIREIVNTNHFLLSDIQIEISPRLSELLYNDIKWSITKEDEMYKKLGSVYTYGSIEMNDETVRILGAVKLLDDVDMIILPMIAHKDVITIRFEDKPASSTTIES